MLTKNGKKIFNSVILKEKIVPTLIQLLPTNVLYIKQLYNSYRLQL